MATLLDIVREIGVTKSTVSRILRGGPSLSTSDEAREKMFAAARVLGYEMKQKEMLNRTATNIMMVHKDTHFMNQVNNAYYFSIRIGIEEACYKRRYKFTFTSFQFIGSVGERPNGALVVGNSERAQVDLILKKIKTSNIVFIGKASYYPGRMDWITCDIKDCAHKNMDYSRERGHRRITYMRGYGNGDTPPNFSKSAYFEQYMKSRPELEFMGSMVGEHGIKSGCQTMNRWLAEDKELLGAFFIFNGLITIGIIRTLNEHSIGVPDVVAVTAINGDSSGTFSFFTLTTVNVHIYEMGKEVVAVLEEWAHHKRTLAKRVESQAELVRRRSVKKTD